MVFNSLVFLLFLGAVLGGFYATPSWRVRKVFLLLASYVFYGAWKPAFTLLLLLSTVIDWVVARRIEGCEKKTVRRGWLILSLATNLGILGFFKYATFLEANFRQLLGLAGWSFPPFLGDIVLPVGISFYTFQSLSYTIDVYRRQTRPWPSFLDFALFVSFFSQLVAGPIVRAVDFLPQLKARRPFSADRFSWGISLLVIGLAGKVALADALLAPVVQDVYDRSVVPSLLDAWVATLAFAGQIFFDFAGYSSCAIGTGLMLGFRLPDNFRFPYAASSPSDFWKRWHITLSTWLRDYLYIPLGGNRRGRSRTLRNLGLTMLLGGLWHGAAWTFVFWGGLHGAFLVLERLFRHWWPSSGTPWGPALGWAVTFLAVNVAWVFFRAQDFDAALGILGAMASLDVGPGRLAGADQLIVAFIMLALITTQLRLRNSSMEDVFQRWPWWWRGLFLAILLLATVTLSGDDHAFIYFQF